MAEELEKVFEKLKQAEKKVDEIQETAVAMRKALVESAAREAEKRRQLLLEEARAWESRLYSEEVSRAEEHAKKLLGEGVIEVDKVKRRAEMIRGRAEELVEKAVLGQF